jgi:hypothetical protein
VGRLCGRLPWWSAVMLPRACRYLYLASNQISGSFPSLVSDLSSLQYVQCVLCVFASARAVGDVHVRCTVCICLCVCVRCMCGVV